MDSDCIEPEADLGPPPPFPMNNDAMHTAIYAAKPFAVSVPLVDLQAGT